MNSFASTWPGATVDPDGNAESNPPPEPGTYDVTVRDAKAFTSKAGNEVMIVELRIASGPSKDYVWPDVRGFKTDAATTAAKSFCARLGVPVEHVGTLDQLDMALKDVVGQSYRVAVVQNGEYRNVYVNERLNGGDSAPSDVPADPADFQPPPADDDPDIPF